jgi:5-methylcytosine-specific restriction enzyme subunit McrC
MRPTIELTERASATCRLGPDDVDYLLATHRSHVEVLPTREPGCFRLTPRGHVGTLVAPGCRLVIRPKIPLRSLCYLLDPAAPITVAEDQSAAAPGTELLDLLAARLAALMAERAAAGLHRAYVEHAAHGPFLQGRLDVPAQLRELPGARDKVHSRFEDFTPDVPCNQFPKATAELVLRSPLLGEPGRQALGRVLRAFAPVRPLLPGPDAVADAGRDRLTAAYRPLLDLCRLLAEALGPTAAVGRSPCPAFLLDMERVFEGYCTRGLSSAFAGRAGFAAAVQPLCRPARAAGGPDLAMRPDFALHRDGRPVTVVDAKWKRSPNVRADLYQVLGYCAALGFRRGVLVYPGRRYRSWDYVFRGGAVRISVATLQVLGTRAACERSLRRLVRYIGSAAPSGPA